MFMLTMPFAFFLLMDLFHLPSVVKYTIDVAWLCLLFSLLNRKVFYIDDRVKKLAAAAGIFFASTIIGFMLNFQSPFYYLWGMRNNARFFIFFFGCIFFIRAESVEYYLKFFDRVFWVNLPIVLFQYFFMGKEQDYLGGIFGVEKGCNAYTNILMIIVVARSVLLYLNEQESTAKCCSKLAAALLIATLAELKVFFLELVLIVGMALVLTKSSYKKLWIAAGTALGIMVFLGIIQVLFPTFANWFTPASIWKSITAKAGYTSQNDMNRLTAVSIAMERFLPSVFDKLFGLGLGNCDYAAYDFLTSPFYMAYRRLNYVWFSSAFLILETGLVGLTTYILFFVMIFLSARKMQRRNTESSLYCQLTQIIAVLSLAMIIYNVSMRTEAAFMMYFVLSLPFLRSMTEKKPESEEMNGFQDGLPPGESERGCGSGILKDVRGGGK